MGSVKIRHNDSEESMEERAREVFGEDVEISVSYGEFGEKIVNIKGDGVSFDSAHDLKRDTWVQSVECFEE